MDRMGIAAPCVPTVVGYSPVVSPDPMVRKAQGDVTPEREQCWFLETRNEGFNPTQGWLRLVRVMRKTMNGSRRKHKAGSRI